MAETYSIQAILSAKDEMSSTMKSALSNVQSFGNQVKSVAAGIGITKAVGAVTNLLTSSLDGAIDRYDTLNSYPKVMNSLGFSTQDAQKSVAKLNQSVQGLPTSLADIVSSAQSLTSVTGNMDKATDTSIALNHALLSSSASTADASRAMTQYSQMLAKGTVDLQSWRTLQETMAPALTKVAKKLGIASGSTTELYDALQSGTISFDDFNNAMIECDTEVGGFADTASEASKGIKTSMTNIKSAVQNLEMGFMSSIDNMLKSSAFDGIVDNLEKVKSKIYDIRSKFMESDDDGLTWNFKPEILSTLSSEFQRIASTAGNVKNAIQDAWHAFENTGAVRSAKEALESVYDAFHKVTNAFANSGALSNLATIIGNIVTQINDLVKVFADWIGNMDSSQLESLTRAVTDLAAAFALIKGAKAIGSKIKDIGKAAKESVSGVKSLYKYLKKLKKGPSDEEGGSSPSDEEGSSSPSTLVDTGAVDQIKAKWEGIGNVIKSVGDSIKTALEGVGNVFKSFGEGVKSALQGVSEVITSIFEGIGSVIESFGTAIATVAEGIGTGLATAFRGLGEAIALVPPTTWLALSVAILAVGAAIALVASQGEGMKLIFEGIAVVIKALQPVIQTVVDGIVQCVQQLPAIFTAIGDAVHSALDGVADVITAFGEAVKSSLDGVADIISAVGDAIKSALDGCADIITAVGDAIHSAFDGVAGVFESIGNAALNAGKGFNQLSKGVERLTNLNLFDMGASLTAVAGGLAEISANSSGIAELGTGMSKFGQGLTAVSTNGALAASTMTQIGESMTNLSTNASTIQETFTTLGTSFTTFSANATTLSTSLLSMTVGLTVFTTLLTMTSASMMLFGTSLTSVTSQFTTLTTSLTSTSTTLTMLQGSITMIGSAMMTISSGAMMGASALMALGTAAMSATTSMMMIGTAATMAMTSFTTAITSGAQSALMALQSACTQMVSVVQSGMSRIPSIASQAMSQFNSALSSGASTAVSIASSMMSSIYAAMSNGYGRAFACGSYIGQGLANGIRSQIGAVQAAAAALAAAADEAIQAKAKIGSPSKVQYQNGKWFAQGLINGMDAMSSKVANAAYDLMYIPQMQQDKLAFSGFSSSLNSDYMYNMQAEYTINVPLSIDGREFAHATVDYNMEAQTNKEKFNKRLRGVK